MEIDVPAGNGDNNETHVSSQWWAEYVREEDKFNPSLSGKLILLAEILRACHAIDDKV